MKFLHKGKLHQENSRRGGMLILVLMIFAVSLILISSAMTITLASRNRYYVDAERSQERLTLSCAAETIIDAIMTQEITDDQLELMATTNGEEHYVITGATGSKLGSSPSASTSKSRDIAPGLANVTGNQTYFTVKPDPDATDDIIMEFSTIIDLTDGADAKSENLRVYLHKKPESNPVQLCANMATFGADGGAMSVPRLHITATKSYTVFHGDVDIYEASGESLIYNTMIFTGKARTAQGTLMYGDVIFYGPDACIDMSAGAGNGVQTPGGLYFLGVDYRGSGTANKQKPLNGSGGSQAIYGKAGAYFYNAEATVSNDIMQNGENQGCKYWVVANGSKITNSNGSSNSYTTYINGGGQYTNNGHSSRNAVDAASLTGGQKTDYDKIIANANKYRTNAEVKSAAEQQVPTTQYMKDTFGGHTNGTSILSSANFGQQFAGGKDYKMSGNYHFSSPTTLDINLADGDTYIYMTGNVSFNNFTIKVSNATNNRLYILLKEGVRFVIGDPNFIYDWKPETGIYSCDQRTSGSFGTVAVTGSQKPACVIAGFGNNVLHVTTQCSVLEAYISLAGDSKIWYQTGGNRFYGRMEALTYVHSPVEDGSVGPQGNSVEMADCPGMNENSGGGDTPLTPGYEVTSYEYFYQAA